MGVVVVDEDEAASRHSIPWKVEQSSNLPKVMQQKWCNLVTIKRALWLEESLALLRDQVGLEWCANNRTTTKTQNLCTLLEHIKAQVIGSCSFL